MLEEKDLTEKDVCKRYELITKSIAICSDMAYVGDIVIATAWDKSIDAMEFKLENKIYGNCFYLSMHTKLKELK
jgi:hypothetical protein